MSKYLLYAVGEIVLVVIGILIALQINNWNEKQKRNQRVNTYLVELQSDLKSDINSLKVNISENEKRINNCLTILGIIKDKKELSKEELIKFMNLHIILRTEEYFIPEKGTIKQIESGSDGINIQNEELRNQIFRYYSMNERIENNNEKRLQLYQNSDITKHIIKTIFLSGDYGEVFLDDTFNRPRIDIRTLALNTDYLNAIVMKMGYTEFQNQIYEDIRITAEKIIDQINEELSIKTKD